MTTTVRSAGPLVATCLGPQWRRSVLSRDARAIIAEYTAIMDLDPHGLRAVGSNARPLTDVEVLITGWGAPLLDAHVLDRLPRLTLVVHAAGTVRGIVSSEVWARGIRVSSAANANARSVVDFVESQIHLSVKNAWYLAATTRAQARVAARDGVRGLDGSTISIIGLGHIGRLLLERLRTLNVTVLAYDPYVPEAECRGLGATPVSLAEAFVAGDVVTLHAPLTTTSHSMIGRELLALLRPGATFINTARGALVDHDALTDILRTRPDIVALLDVTDPEPLPAGHPLLSLPNTFLTPHIAGSLGTDEARLGLAAAHEIARYFSGQSLAHEMKEEALVSSA